MRAVDQSARNPVAAFPLRNRAAEGVDKAAAARARNGTRRTDAGAQLEEGNKLPHARARVEFVTGIRTFILCFALDYRPVNQRTGAMCDIGASKTAVFTINTTF